ncbi:MAG TPA: ROK family protein [Tepidisphaeraceae bacterium]|nr:ROK family protein [Tepidisphaeraceae bacterium]
MSDTPLYLGLDIGGTKCAAVAGTAAGEIVDRAEWPSLALRGPAAMLDELFVHARQLMQKHTGMVSIGASIGGPLDAANGIVHSPPNLPGWDAVPLKALIEQQLGKPARVEHDAAACALAEYRWGAGRGASRLIYLTCGTGFGAGFIIDGAIYRGAGGRSIEIGHAQYRDDGPSAFGKRGSNEAFCAAEALGRLAAWQFPARWPTAPASKTIADLAAAGDADALSVVQLNARAVGDVCATLGDLLRPDVILLGSLARYLGSNWVDAVRQRFRQEVLSDTAAMCRLEPAGLGTKLQDCSALAVAIPR